MAQQEVGKGKFKLIKEVLVHNEMNLLLKILWKLHERYNYLQITDYLFTNIIKFPNIV